jgi:hypothetical protein
VLLAILALVIQAFVVQPHIHFDLDWSSLASLARGLAPTASVSDLADLQSGDDPDHCAICHEQMGGGRTVVLDGVHLLPPNAAIFIAVYAEALSAAYGIISHDWLGRGPPTV